MKPTIRKVEAYELCPPCKDAPGGSSAVLIKYGSNGYDLTVPAGRHAWLVDHGTWHDYYLLRREAREARKRFLKN